MVSTGTNVSSGPRLTRTRSPTESISRLPSAQVGRRPSALSAICLAAARLAYIGFRNVDGYSPPQKMNKMKTPTRPTSQGLRSFSRCSAWLVTLP